MTLTVGSNTYVTLQEIKSMCRDKKVLALSDADLEFLAMQSFDWLEDTYTVFQYPKLNATQTANFPLSIHLEGQIPIEVKKAQILTMSLINEEENEPDNEVSSRSIGEMSESYVVTGKRERKREELKDRIDNQMSKFRVIGI
jgi:hypothetical protein